MKTREGFGWVIGLLILLGGCLQSCSTVEKRINKAQLIAIKYPDSFARFCANAFPVKESIKETIKYVPADNKNYQNTIDSLNTEIGNLKTDIDNDTTETSKVYQKKINELISTVNRLKKDYKPCKPDTVFKDRIVEMENTAKLAAVSNELAQTKAELKVEQYRRLESDKKAKERLWWCIGLVGIIGLYVFLRFKKIVPF